MTTTRIVRATTFYPWIALVFLHAAWYSAWRVLGHQPTMRDDPHRLSAWVNLLDTLFLVMLLSAPLAFFGGLLTIGWFGRAHEGMGASKPAGGWRLLSGLVVSWCLAVVLLFVDPVGAFVWFLD